jgi:hypothetical protein
MPGLPSYPRDEHPPAISPSMIVTWRAFQHWLLPFFEGKTDTRDDFPSVCLASVREGRNLRSLGWLHRLRVAKEQTKDVEGLHGADRVADAVRRDVAFQDRDRVSEVLFA